MNESNLGSDEDLAAALDRLVRHGDFKILKRLKHVSRFHDPNPLDTNLRVGVAIDVETTGLDRDGDRIIELALQRFRFDSSGRIVELGQPRLWREDPGILISPAITELTGLTNEDLAGQTIDETLAVEILLTADIIVAHNASFDRPFVDRRLPAIAEQRWACTLNEVDWRALGFDGRALSHLLTQCGWFYQGHRADNDVLALIYLMAHQVGPATTILSLLMTRSEQPNLRCHAVDAPYDTKDRLKARGYKWDPVLRNWWREVQASDRAAECAWLDAEIYRAEGKPLLIEMTARERYR